MKNIVGRANRAHDIIMDLFYYDLLSLQSNTDCAILAAANSIADPIGDQLTEESFESVINALISNLEEVPDIGFIKGIEKLRELL